MEPSKATIERPAGWPWLFALALLTAIATFPLLFWGGLVTSYDVGMAVPDWPTTFEQNMFTYPWLKAPMGVFIEHGHRLLGAAVGILGIALALTTTAVDDRRWVKGLAWGVLLAICVQGLLGGMRVRLNEVFGRQLAMVHGVCGQATFGLIVFFVMTQSRRWRSAAARVNPEVAKVRFAAASLVALLLAQITLGASVRHLGHGVAIHLALAAGVMLLAMWLVLMIAIQDEIRATLLAPAVTLFLLLLTQIFLGFGALFLTGLEAPGMGKPPTFVEAITATAHQAMGSLLLANAIVLAVGAYRYLRPLKLATSSATAAVGATA